MRSLNEHVFLIARDMVSGAVFFNGYGAFVIIEFNDFSEDFLIIKHQSDM